MTEQDHCRLTNLTGKIIKSFHRNERGQKTLYAEVSEVQEKPELEIETIIAIKEAALIIDEPVTTVERDCQHQEARTEAEIGRTRVVPSIQRQSWVLSEKNVVVSISEMMLRRNARIVLNVGVLIFSNKISGIQTRTS